MNKIVRYGLIISILIFLAILGSSYVSAGCCYALGNTRCSTGFTQDACTTPPIGSPDNIYDDTSCANIDECEAVCCCKPSSPYTAYYYARGECERMNSTGDATDWIRVANSQNCLDYCSGTIDACDPQCGENTGDCISKDGLIENPNPTYPFYYCEQNGQVYDRNNQAACYQQCRPGIEECTKDSQITETCICDGLNRTSGYCCADGRYDLNPSGANCMADNNCIIIAGFRCADGCLDWQEHEPAYDYPSACPSELPYCCGDEAPSYTDCCDQYELCEGEELNYLYASCNALDPTKDACSVGCRKLDCIIGDWRINSGVNYHIDFTHCYCDGDYYSISSDTGYCCDDGTPDGVYQTTSCALDKGSISGSVYNATDSTGSKWIRGARVEVRKLDTIIAVAYTDVNGAYIFTDLPYDSYTIIASVAGFIANSITVDLSDTSLTGRNIALTPRIEGPCDSFNPPAPSVVARHVKGKSLVNLTWAINCDNVNEFIIQRTPELPLGEIKTEGLFFIDENVSWGTTYSYSVRAHYTTNALSDLASVTITLGNPLCEGILDDEELCLNASLKISSFNIYRYECNGSNILKLIEDCYSQNKKVCVGPDENGLTECISNVSCKCSNDNDCIDQGTPSADNPYPFGLYYEKSNCLNNGNNWCYYDYSKTTIDKCDDCKGKTCYDYKSKDACLEDNCRASGAYVNGENGYNNGCEWIDLWGEFGKGICYDPDFEDNKCSLCEEGGGVFFNIGCSQSICSSLGDCYSSGGSCLNCSSEWNSRTTCETYETRESCIGANNGQEINFVNNGCSADVPIKITSSNDACNLGVCKWHDAFGCYKDANDDDTVDCNQDDCRKDLKAPLTMPQKNIPNMNASGFYIEFFGYDDDNEGSYADKFYFCVDSANTCCPTNLKLFTDGSVFINPVNYLTDYSDAGIYYVRYYSVDNHKNVEEVRRLEVYIDKTPPVYSLPYTVEKQSETLSNLTLELISDEFIKCSYILSPSVSEVGATIVKDEFALGKFNKTFKLIIKNLPDNIYTLTTICKDDVDNTNITDWFIFVDALQQIRNPYPVFRRLTSTNVKLYVETTDNSDCVANGIQGYTGQINLHQQATVDPYNFTHSYTGTFTDRTYRFEVECIPELGVTRPDSAFLSFTVDTTAPVTSVSKDGEEFNFSDWYRPPIAIELGCNDAEISGEPGEFGCDDSNIRYCVSNTPLCTPIYHPDSPSTVVINSLYSVYFRYYSLDKGGNIEGEYNRIIQIDNDGPQITLFELIYPPDVVLTGSSPVTDMPTLIVRVGGVSSLSELKKLSITVIGESNFTNYQIPLSGDTFLKATTVMLYHGNNTISISVENLAGGRTERSRSIYYDLVGPAIAAGVFDHEGYRIDNNQIFVPSFGWQSAEYGQIIVFNSSITDISGVSIGEITIQCDQTTNSSCSSYSPETFSLIRSGNYFGRIVSSILPVGNYTATFKAWDNLNNYNEIKLWFLVNDTIPPFLDLIPDLPSVVYYPDYVITGITEPDSPVEVMIIDQNNNVGIYGGGNSQGIITPKAGFSDAALDVIGSYPIRGQNNFTIRGNWEGILNIGDYLEFSNHDKIPRYRITNVIVTPGTITSITQIFIDPPLEQNLDGATTISAYISPYPSGWFSIPVSFGEGVNNVFVYVMQPSGVPFDIFDQVRYDASAFDIIMTNPFDEMINYNDFANAGNAIPLRIRTEMGGGNIRTNCTISHTGNDIIAKEFKDVLMGTTDNVFHTFTIDQDSCKENGGDYCLIGGTAQYDVNYHHYRINCTPIDVGMPSQIEDICFTVATWGRVSGRQERGVNICGNSVGCGSLVPFPCSGAIDCQDTFHNSNQNNCRSEGFCKWSPGYGCGSSCYLDLVDYDGDGICTQPPIVCSDYNGSGGSCLSHSACKWCPSIATVNANKCLTSCNNCGGFTEDTDPVDGECDEGGEGSGGWGD